MLDSKNFDWFSKDGNMIDILGIKYISEKEAVTRYGHSPSWFQKQRLNDLPPYCVRLQGKGKVYYPVEETDKWFKDNLKSTF